MAVFLTKKASEISELKNNDKLMMLAQVRSIEQKNKKDEKKTPYLVFTFEDETGTVEAFFVDKKGKELKDISPIIVDDVVKIKGYIYKSNESKPGSFMIDAINLPIEEGDDLLIENFNQLMATVKQNELPVNNECTTEVVTDEKVIDENKKPSYVNLTKIALGEDIKMALLVKVMEEKPARNGSHYVDFILADASGTIDGKKWDTTKSNLKDIEQGSIVIVEGTMTEWKKGDTTKKQLKIESIRIATENDIFDVDNIYKSAPILGLKMYQDIFDFVETFKHEGIKKLTLSLLEKNKEKLITAPAAMTVHHDYKAGLLFHTYQMLRSAKSHVRIYFGEIEENCFSNPEIVKDFDMDNPNRILNPELLYAGTILHDIGKIYELDSDENGITKDYSKDGKLLGHTIIGQDMVTEESRILDIDKELSRAVKHMILSHHFEETWGAYQKPMFIEAELLHFIDMIDSRMGIAIPTLENVTSGLFSDKVIYMEGRKLYRHGI